MKIVILVVPYPKNETILHKYGGVVEVHNVNCYSLASLPPP